MSTRKRGGYQRYTVDIDLGGVRLLSVRPFRDQEWHTAWGPRPLAVVPPAGTVVTFVSSESTLYKEEGAFSWSSAKDTLHLLPVRAIREPGPAPTLEDSVRRWG